MKISLRVLAPLLFLLGMIVAVATADAKGPLPGAGDSAVADTTSAAAAERYRMAYTLDSMRLENEHDAQLRTIERGSVHAYIPFIALSIPILAIVVFAILAVRVIAQRKAERMAMIERGITAAIFEGKAESTNKYSSLRSGMVMTGLGLGLLLALLIFQSSDLDHERYEILMIAMPVFWAGAGQIGYHLIVRRLERRSAP